MPQPIDMTTPPSAYGANPGFQPVQTTANQPMGFTGNAPAMQQAAEIGNAPAQARLTADQAKVDQNTKAAQFKQFVAGGLNSLQTYVADLSKQNPELGKKASMELQSVAPFYQGMKADEMEKTSIGLLDSWNNQLNGFKTRKAVGEGKSLTEVLAGSNLGEKETITALGQQENRNNAKDIAQIRADSAMKAVEAKEKMKRDDQALRLRIASMKKGSSGKFQYTYNQEKDLQATLDKQIGEWQKTIDENGPAASSALGYIAHMDKLQSLKIASQARQNRSVEKGAKPDELVDMEDNTTMPEVGSSMDDSILTPQSTDQDIAAALKSTYKTWTDAQIAEAIPQVRKNLMGASDSTGAR